MLFRVTIFLSASLSFTGCVEVDSPGWGKGFVVTDEAEAEAGDCLMTEAGAGADVVAGADSPHLFAVTSPSRRLVSPQEGEIGPLCCSAAAAPVQSKTTARLRRQENIGIHLETA